MISYWLAPTATVCAAIFAALFAYMNNVRLHEAQERLKWINAQLGEFYGPLYSISEASAVQHQQFRKLVRPEGGYLFDHDLTDEEKKEWRYWMANVFMPTNRRMFELIVLRSHLLIGDEIPETFSRFCAHISAYEIVVHKWGQGDVSVIYSPVQFPQGFREEIASTFLSLKRKQQELLRRVEPDRPHVFKTRRLSWRSRGRDAGLELGGSARDREAADLSHRSTRADSDSTTVGKDAS